MPARRYRTRARCALEEFFKANADQCYTARDIIRDPALSLSAPSVFRLLSAMTEDGFLERIAARDGEGAAYRFRKEEHRQGHFHLKCESCGETVCTDCGFMEELEAHFSKEHGFSISVGNTVLYGKCQKCRNKERTE